MNPTDAQLAARLNPTAAYLNLPAGGEVFRLSSNIDPTGSAGIFYRDPSGKVMGLDWKSLAVQKYGPDPDRLGGPLNFRNGVTIGGQEALKELYGIDFTKIPQKEYNDLGSLQQQGGGSLDPNFLKSLLNAGAQNINGAPQLVNSTPNSLAPGVQPGALSNNGSTVPQQSSGGAAVTPTTPTSTNAVANVPTSQDATLENFLKSSTLPQDLKEVIKSTYNAVATNDVAKANQMIAAFNSATQYSDPYFKAQSRIVTDALSHAIQAQEGDLAFKEKQLKTSYDQTNADVTSAKDFLSFQHNQELQDLARQYQKDLQATQDDLASRGLSSSSIRSRSEKILNDKNQGLVQTSNKQFSYQTGALDRKLANLVTNNATALNYYQQLAQQKKLDALRTAEQQVGSTNLSALGYNNLLGNVGGEIPREQVTDALSFAGNFVF